MSVFSLKIDFPACGGTPMIFRISAAAELVASALADAPYHPRRPRVVVRQRAVADSTRIPSTLKLHWRKSIFARKSDIGILEAF